MITRRQLDTLMADYIDAVYALQDAAKYLDNATRVAGMVSPEFPRRANRLAEDAFRLYQQVTTTIEDLDATPAEDD